jgi:chemotaxis protein MotB
LLGAALGYGLDEASIIEGTSSTEAAALWGLSGALLGALVGDYMDDDVDADVDALNARIAELEQQLAACREENEALRRQIADLQNQKAELERQLAAAGQGGGRIERSIENDVLFAPGSAVITQEGRTKLDQIAQEIKANFAGRKVQVEGHTDSQPIRYSGWKSNWELGAARALAVLHYLEDRHQIQGETLSASTYSFHRPVASNDTPEGRAQNRRSVIVIYTGTATMQ